MYKVMLFRTDTNRHTNTRSFDTLSEVNNFVDTVPAKYFTFRVVKNNNKLVNWG